MPDFKLVADFKPTGDQPHAIERLTEGLSRGLRHQTLLGATGTGKTFSIAQVIERQNRPTLVLAHNKTLAAQLYAEFREFFPDNAVEYFVSYFDYYQPEAYLPRSDTYIEKDSSRNEEIDKLRHAATHALFERRDVIIVASVSCIYGLGAPVDYGATVLRLRKGGQYRRDAVLRHLVDLQYQRNDQALQRARFRVRGDTLEIGPASDDRIVRVEFFGDEVERITEVDPLTGELLAERNDLNVYPATHFVTPADKLKEALVDIEAEMELRVGEMGGQGPGPRGRPAPPADQLRPRDDAGAWKATAPGSRTTAAISRAAWLGSRPWTLLEYFRRTGSWSSTRATCRSPRSWACVQERPDPQGDPGRLRLPPAVRLDNRPLTFEEPRPPSTRPYMSATPGPYELEKSERSSSVSSGRPASSTRRSRSARPRGEIDDLLEEIGVGSSAASGPWCHHFTKKMAEDLADYLREYGVKVQYPHSEVDTLSGSRSATSGSACSTSWSGSTSCARGSTCPRSPWWRSSTPTRKVSCAAPGP